jgi:alpha-methylacyl-CoA racemase
MGLFHAYLASGSWVDRPASNLLDGAAPFYRCYTCKDGGHVAIGPLEPQFFAQLIKALEVASDRFDQYDRSQWPEMERVFADIFLSQTRDHWEAVFAGTDACVSPVLSIREAMIHTANVERGVFEERDGLPQAVPAPRFSATPGAIRQSRKLGVDDVLAEWRAE